jgi:hypothetical protein
MTMQHPIHPDPERLAALAGGDAEAMADAGLRAHVAACVECEPQLAELRQLCSALAELPDLVPNRRLQLVPPVAPQPAASGGLLRRLAAPFMAGGAALVLVGAIGSSGVLNSMAGMGAAFQAGAVASAGDAGSESVDNVAASQPEATRQGAANYGSEDSRSAEPSALSGEGNQTVAPMATDDGAVAEPLSTSPNDGPASPWTVILIVGAGMAASGVLLRLVPRAGP